jgi:uncharacterized protein (DUF849 family)
VEKLIISVGITGSRILPMQTPYLKITPKEIAEDAIRCADAGAASVHIHVRDPKDGRPSTNVELFLEAATRIKAKSDAIICPTTGGARGQSFEEKIKVVPALKPELATHDIGSMTGSAASQIRSYKDEDYKYAWEKDYLRDINSMPADMPYNVIVDYGKIFQENGTKPEYELFDIGWLYSAQYIWRHFNGFCKPPLWLQFCMGGWSGIKPTPSHLIHMKQTADSLFGDNYQWSLLAMGYPANFHLASMAIIMGGHVRVGLEDNLYIKEGILAKSSAEMVERVVRLARELDREIATPEEARIILNLKGKDKVNF